MSLSSSLNADEGPFIIRISAAMVALSGIAVCLRFLSRRLVKAPFLWDDWMILTALPFAWATSLLNVTAVGYGGFGRHIQTSNPETVSKFFQVLYGVQIVYPIDIALTKFSILLFFGRIFNVPQFKLPMVITAAIITAWVIAMVLAAVFSCLPIHGFWDHETPANCVNTLHYYLGVAIPNIATDIVLLVLPMPLIWRLQITLSQKVAVTGIFVLGGFIVVISSLRLVSVFQAQHSTDFTSSLVYLGIYNAVETNIGIVCACLPSMRPLLRLLLRGTLRPTIKTPKDPAHSTSVVKKKYWPHSTKSHGSDSAAFTRLDDSANTRGLGQYGQTVSVQTGDTDYREHARNDDINLDEMRPLDRGINVRRDVDLTSSPRQP